QAEGAMAEGDFALFSHMVKGTLLGGMKSVATSKFGDFMGGTGLGKRVEFLDKAGGSAGSFIEHTALKYIKSVTEGMFGMAIDPDKWAEWADGKGFNFDMMKSLFIEPAIKTLGEVSFTRSSYAARTKLYPALVDEINGHKENIHAL